MYVRVCVCVCACMCARVCAIVDAMGMGGAERPTGLGIFDFTIVIVIDCCYIFNIQASV